MKSRYSTIQLPRSFDDSPNGLQLLQTLSHHAKALRLEALQTDPEAYGSTYKRESAFTDQQWQTRITHPLSRTFVAVDCGTPWTADSSKDPHSRFSRLYTLPWIGSAVLYGPKLHTIEPLKVSVTFWEMFNVAAGESDPQIESEIPDKSTVIYVVNTVYINPEARGQGVGKQMMQSLLKSARHDYALQSRRVSHGKCVVFVDKDNAAARALYQSCGFELTGEDDYVGFEGRKRTALTLVKNLGDR